MIADKLNKTYVGLILTGMTCTMHVILHGRGEKTGPTTYMLMCAWCMWVVGLYFQNTFIVDSYCKAF